MKNSIEKIKEFKNNLFMKQQIDELISEKIFFNYFDYDYQPIDYKKKKYFKIVTLMAILHWILNISFLPVQLSFQTGTSKMNSNRATLYT